VHSDHLAYAADFGSPKAFTAPEGRGRTHPRGESPGECYNDFVEHEHIVRSHLKKVKPRRLLFYAMAGIAAVRAFSRDQAGRGQVLPEFSMQDLLKGGYVTSNKK